MSDIKRSVRIAGHRTSVTLEPEFWDALKDIAREAGLSLNALIARIDAERLPATANLSRAVRLYVLQHYKKRG
jgi:predicted DNA-binding ribbon-helix-helix protein